MRVAIVGLALILGACVAAMPRAPKGPLEQIEAAEVTAQQLATSIYNQTCMDIQAGKCVEPGKSLMPEQALAAFDKVQRVRKTLRQAATLSDGGLAECLGEPRNQQACLAAAQAALLELERLLLTKGN